MRVIAGRYKGFRLRSPAGRDLRPSSGRLREALFSILAGGLEGASFLDLYAGTGAVGIEALSRGAVRAVFVEKDPAACRVIRRNLSACGADEVSEVMAADALAALGKLEARGEGFRLAFADPPYTYPGVPRLLAAVARRDVLGPGGLFVLERPRGEEPEAAAPLVLVRRERYGGSALSFFEKAGERG